MLSTSPHAPSEEELTLTRENSIRRLHSSHSTDTRTQVAGGLGGGVPKGGGLGVLGCLGWWDAQDSSTWGSLGDGYWGSMGGGWWGARGSRSWDTLGDEYWGVWGDGCWGAQGSWSWSTLGDGVLG